MWILIAKTQCPSVEVQSIAVYHGKIVVVTIMIMQPESPIVNTSNASDTQVNNASHASVAELGMFNKTKLDLHERLKKINDRYHKQHNINNTSRRPWGV